MAGRIAASETEVVGIMNNQPDVLVAIVKAHLPDDPKTKGHLGDLYIMDVDKDGTYFRPSHPTIDYFKTPPMFPFTLPLFAALVCLLILYFGEGKNQMIDDARQWIGVRAGFSTITWCTYFAAAMHLAAEPALLIWMTGRHHVPIGPRLKWLAWNVVVGWGAIDEFFECTLYEKVRHVYKQTDVGDIGPYIKTAVSEEKKTQ